MASKKLETELLRRLSAETQKGRRNIFIKDINWKRAEEWCSKQTPKVNVSHLIDALLEMFFEEQEDPD